jgi:hypothetical protein
VSRECYNFPDMTRFQRNGLIAVVTLVLAGSGVAAQQGKPAAKPKLEAEVFLTPTCGCCSKWTDHIEAAGFTAKRNVMPDLSGVPARQKVPRHLQSCHTAVIGKYVVEGHVPVDVIQKMLKEQPEIVGIAVPGMPIGSPGMEGPNPRPYSVVAFKADGTRSEYARK